MIYFDGKPIQTQESRPDLSIELLLPSSIQLGYLYTRYYITVYLFAISDFLPF